MIIDLIHSTPPARNEIFKINDQYGSQRRPLVFSHSGVQGIFHNDEYPGDRLTNPSDEDIDRIQRCGGVIGIIFMKYWLSGRDDRMFMYDASLQDIYDTVKHIHSITGTYDNIAIGSDLDGMNDPGDDIYDTSFIPNLRNYLSRKGINDNDLDKIFSGNALRVLKEGWGK